MQANAGHRPGNRGNNAPTSFVPRGEVPPTAMYVDNCCNRRYLHFIAQTRGRHASYAHFLEETNVSKRPVRLWAPCTLATLAGAPAPIASLTTLRCLDNLKVPFNLKVPYACKVPSHVHTSLLQQLRLAARFCAVLNRQSRLRLGAQPLQHFLLLQRRPHRWYHDHAAVLYFSGSLARQFH